jgi:DNA-binding response OmpR family regulator
MSTPTSILIVDDDPDDRELLMEAIKEFNDQVICDEISGSVEALKILSSDRLNSPQYIFLDLNMPMMTGKECLAEIKKMEHLTKSNIIIYTTSQREDDVHELLELGALFFLVKPSVFSELKEAIRYILSGDTGDIKINNLLKR